MDIEDEVLLFDNGLQMFLTGSREGVLGGDIMRPRRNRLRFIRNGSYQAATTALIVILVCMLDLILSQRDRRNRVHCNGLDRFNAQTH